MQTNGEWGHARAGNQEIVEEFDLNVGGLVGAVAAVEGAGRLITGTRNDESSLGHEEELRSVVAPVDRLTVHSVRDAEGQVLGLGPRLEAPAGGEAAAGPGVAVGGGWEPAVEAWISHGAAVTGIDVIGGFGDMGGSSLVATSGGDGYLRLFGLVLGGERAGSDDPEPETSMRLQGEAAAHRNRATGVAATTRRCVTVAEDGSASLVEISRLSSRGEQRGFGTGRGGHVADTGDDCVIWKGKAIGGLPLAGVALQGESDAIFATAGCDPKSQLMLWDARAKSRPALKFGRVRGSDAPFLCIASQPFNPEIFACGASSGEVFLWDVRAGEVVRELQSQDPSGAKRGTWGIAFHPRQPRHLFSGSGTGELKKWFLPPPGQMNASMSSTYGRERGIWEGGRSLFQLPSRSALAGVCYDEGADTVSAVSKHGHLIVAHGVPGLRL